MKTIGLLGGMSWESSLEYYRIINETAKGLLGELNSAKSLMYTFNFKEIERLQRQGDWTKLTYMMVDVAKKLEEGGADLIVICTNTMHKVADQVQKEITIPLIHIADSTAEKIIQSNLKKIGLLGTKFTMEEAFYRKRLAEKYELEVIIPDEIDRQIVHDTIYNELVVGKIKESSRQKFIRIIQGLKMKGVEGVILGCTEIPLLIRDTDVDIPLFDTTLIHAQAAVKYAIEDYEII
ncbi:MAG: aspartate/glutamate racemase family protein [Candidatus Hodarchaeota archaeon]